MSKQSEAKIGVETSLTVCYSKNDSPINVRRRKVLKIKTKKGYLRNIFENMGPNTRFSELDGFSRQPIGTRHFASTTHAARTPRRVPMRAAASELPRMDPFETPPATQSSVDPFGTPPATPRPAPNAADFVNAFRSNIERIGALTYAYA